MGASFECDCSREPTHLMTPRCLSTPNRWFAGSASTHLRSDRRLLLGIAFHDLDHAGRANSSAWPDVLDPKQDWSSIDL